MALINPDKAEVTFAKIFILEFTALIAIFLLLKIV